MTVVVITPPGPFLDLETAKAHVRADDDDDTLIAAYVGAACGHIDGPEAWLGRAIGRQTLELRLNEFPYCHRSLGYPPLVSVTSVKYLDVAGAEQVVNPASYVVDETGIELSPGAAWPAAYMRRDAIRIRYEAGYVTPPPAIVAATLLMVGDLYQNRETSGAGVISAVPMSTTVANLLSPFRVWNP